ncbi:MAG: hypothetical protein QOD04_5902 [Pseudonocardiales bacterium]|nr:hypothetical protein [Pseudonocardiales bacterium]
MATVGVVPTRSTTRALRQWLLIVAVAAGLIGMHHLVAPATPAPAAQSDAVGAAPTHLGMDMGGPLLATANQPVSVSEPGCCPCMGAMMGHPCQAVLGADADAAAEAMLLAATAASRDAPLATPGAAASTLPARSPPSNGVRFSQLGVWRR